MLSRENTFNRRIIDYTVAHAAMIFLSRVLDRRVNRWANIIAAVIIIVYVIGGGSTHPHYIFLVAIEVVSMLLIIWYAWRWAAPENTLS